MVESPSQEFQVFLDRLKKSEPKQIASNSNAVLSLYPIRDPTSELTVFDEVYRHVDEKLLCKQYRFKFLYFLDTLLSSTKVPSYIIATYIKRLSRLTLTAKPKTLFVIIKLVGNLFLRHPVLIFLRDQVDELARVMESKSTTCTLSDWLKQDPFDADQKESLKQAKAMTSCIWEMMPLRYHENRRIANTASYLSSPEMLDIEFDLSEHVI